MNLCTRLASSLATTLLVAGALAAQPPGGPPPGGPPPLERAFDDVTLTEKQRAQVEDVLRAHRERMRRIQEQERATVLKELKDVLTDAQLKQVRDAFDRMPLGPGGRGGRGGRGGGPLRGVPVDDLVERVMAFDKNKDGKVTKDELPERMHYLFELGDTNKDGALDREELQRLAEKLRDQGPPAQGPRGGRGGRGGPPPG
jgi:hypothetical protein